MSTIAEELRTMTEKVLNKKVEKEFRKCIRRARFAAKRGFYHITKDYTREQIEDGFGRELKSRLASEGFRTTWSVSYDAYRRIHTLCVYWDE